MGNLMVVAVGCCTITGSGVLGFPFIAFTFVVGKDVALTFCCHFQYLFGLSTFFRFPLARVMIVLAMARCFFSLSCGGLAIIQLDL